MILVFGGTTEGRICAKVLDEAGRPFFYSTRGTEQHVESTNGMRVTGGMDRQTMTEFCAVNGIRLIVDAAHPFARQLHATVAEVSLGCGIPAVRYERTFPRLSPRDIVCSDYDDAVRLMRVNGVRRLLALTGVKTIKALKPFWQSSGTECFFRILNRDESFDMARDAGFPHDHLLLYDDGRSVGELISELHPDAIITKESGESGGFDEKEQAAAVAGVPLYVVSRPALSDSFITVTGKYGLRRAVEKYVPGFYPLRTGFTTGSCATASAKAALMAMLGTIGRGSHVVSFVLPDGEEMKMETTVKELSSSHAVASAIKDAGDDPDIINQHEIVVRVDKTDEERDDKIRFFGGKGIGTVTLPGLDIPIGGPAINKTPRKMIITNLSPLYDGSLNITISVPDGEELATHTFNPKIGIVGGISIIGTSGIVKPFSAEAFADAVKREMEVAVAMGGGRIVMNSGAKSEGYIKKEYPGLPPQAFIHYGNFIGGCLAAAKDLGVPNVTLGSMLGKAVKLAAGNLDTHSHSVVMDRDFLKRTAHEAGCSDEALEVIGGINLARELWTRLSADDARKFFPRIASLCAMHCTSVYDTGNFTFMLIDEEGNIRERINES